MTLETTKSSQVIENETVKCGLISDRIFYSYNKPNQLCTADDMEFIFNHHAKLSQGKKMFILAEMAPFSSMDKSAREYLEEHQVPAICEAVIIHSLSQRMLINFYHKFKSHKHPSKVFKNLDNALKWVNSFE